MGASPIIDASWWLELKRLANLYAKAIDRYFCDRFFDEDLIALIQCLILARLHGCDVVFLPNLLLLFLVI